MSKSIDSNIIQEELKKINKLQEEIYKSILTFGMMNIETKLEYIKKLEILLEKQHTMYTMLSLSDNQQVVEIKENLKKSVIMLGFPPETDMSFLFSSMSKTIKSLKHYIDN